MSTIRKDKPQGPSPEAFDDPLFLFPVFVDPAPVLPPLVQLALCGIAHLLTRRKPQPPDKPARQDKD